MKLDQVQIKDFRNLSNVTLEPGYGLNLIYGANGSGKSSCLEALHYLGFGRSFRTHRHDNVIKDQCDAFVVFAQLTPEETERDSVRIGYRRFRRGQVEMRCNGQDLSRVSDLVRYLPIQLFTPQSGDVITGGPGGRRRFLDWALFHVEHRFHQVSVRYEKTLRQRNALLKKQPQAIAVDGTDFWSQQLIQYGDQLDGFRQALVSALKPFIQTNLCQFLTDFSFEISYHRGWDRNLTLEETVTNNCDRDKRYGFTHSGPHKADLKLKTEGRDAAEVLSRGQTRMLMAALLLSESEYLHQVTGSQSIFLLDDIGAELDSVMRQRFIDKLMALSAQVFVTAIDREQVKFIDDYNDKKVFHVEHGQVKEELV